MFFQVLIASLYADSTTNATTKIVQLILLLNKYSVIVYHTVTALCFEASRNEKRHSMK